MNDDINVQIRSTVLEGFGKRKAMFMPMVCVSSFMLVGYAALDTEAPEIYTEYLELELNQELDASLIEAGDNMDDRSAITINIDQANYNPSVAGEYTVNVTATDSFNNTSEAKAVSVVVKDKTKPVISIKEKGANFSANSNTLELRYHSDGDIKKYITAIDNDTNAGINGDITDYINASSKIDTSKLGAQFIHVDVTDDSGNTADQLIPVYIIDDVAPKLDLMGDGYAKINFGDSFDLSQFAEAIDEYEGNLTSKIQVEGEAPNTSVMGDTSTLKLTVKDSSGNTTTKELTLTVADTEAPTISFSDNNFHVKMGSGSINVASYVSVSDNYDSKVTNVTYSLPTIDTSSEGDYTCIVTATDSSGNDSSRPFTVSVYDPDTYTNSRIVELVLAQVGKPYVWGATGPNAFDCSGLVQWVYAQAGKYIPRTVEPQYYASDMYIYSVSDLQPGDLVFFNTFEYLGHVGIYIGGGQFVHAGTPETGVQLASFNSYWYSVFECGGRYF